MFSHTWRLQRRTGTAVFTYSIDEIHIPFEAGNDDTKVIHHMPEKYKSKR